MEFNKKEKERTKEEKGNRNKRKEKGNKLKKKKRPIDKQNNFPPQDDWCPDNPWVMEDPTANSPLAFVAEHSEKWHGISFWRVESAALPSLAEHCVEWKTLWLCINTALQQLMNISFHPKSKIWHLRCYYEENYLNQTKTKPKSLNLISPQTDWIGRVLGSCRTAVSLNWNNGMTWFSLCLGKGTGEIELDMSKLLLILTKRQESMWHLVKFWLE